MNNPIPKIKSAEELENIYNQARKEKEKLGTVLKEKVMVCMGGGCLASGSQALKDSLTETVRKSGLEKTVAVVGTGCLGPCSLGPVILMSRDKVLYENVRVDDVEEIVQSHIKHNKTVERLVFREDTESKPIPVLRKSVFLNARRRWCFATAVKLIRSA
jgi:(2Fe-2S) ferredoxin